MWSKVAGKFPIFIQDRGEGGSGVLLGTHTDPQVGTGGMVRVYYLNYEHRLRWQVGAALWFSLPLPLKRLLQCFD